MGKIYIVCFVAFLTNWDFGETGGINITLFCSIEHWTARWNFTNHFLFFSILVGGIYKDIIYNGMQSLSVVKMFQCTPPYRNNCPVNDIKVHHISTVVSFASTVLSIYVTHEYPFLLPNWWLWTLISLLLLIVSCVSIHEIFLKKSWIIDTVIYGILIIFDHKPKWKKVLDFFLLSVVSFNLITKLFSLFFLSQI